MTVPGATHYARHELVELGYLKSAFAQSSESFAFNVQPRKDGSLWIGSSRQNGNDDPQVQPDIVRRMMARAIEFVPVLATLPVVRTWAGFRPATSDKLPLIGRWPADPRMLIATGHEGLGITTAPSTARLLADLILDRPTPIPIEPYAPARRNSI